MAKGTRHSEKISIVKESKTPGKKKGVGRATVLGRSEQSWRWVTVPSMARAISEALAQLPSKGNGV